MKRTTIAFCTIVLLISSSLVMAFSSGPPNGRTGAPGDSNCSVSCHTSFVLNSGEGSVTITAPATYQPSGTSIITIDVEHEGQQRWGFEAVVLDANNLQVGGIIVDDMVRTQSSIDPSTSREYVKHNSVGTDNGTLDVGPGWTFHWVAPGFDAGPVTVYVAGNAANGNFSNQGDYIYTTSFTITPAPTACCIGIRGNIDGDELDQMDIADLVYYVAFSFGGGPPPSCTEEADVDATGALDIGDIVYMVTFMFGGGPAPLACP